jgi:hypothetical protein
MKPPREEIINQIRGFVKEQGLAFLSKEDEVNYYRNLVELIENVLHEETQRNKK